MSLTSEERKRKKIIIITRINKEKEEKANVSFAWPPICILLCLNDASPCTHKRHCLIINFLCGSQTYLASWWVQLIISSHNLTLKLNNIFFFFSEIHYKGVWEVASTTNLKL